MCYSTKTKYLSGDVMSLNDFKVEIHIFMYHILS